MNVGRADTLGSGVRNLYKYTKIYCGGEPTLEEGDVFRIFVPLQTDEQNSGSSYDALTERQRLILDAVTANPKVQIEKLMELFDLSRSTINREIKEIRKTTSLYFDKKEQCWFID